MTRPNAFELDKPGGDNRTLRLALLTRSEKLKDPLRKETGKLLNRSRILSHGIVMENAIGGHVWQSQGGKVSEGRVEHTAHVDGSMIPGQGSSSWKLPH
eukprot:749565-Hanusia_phi.AAC.1